LARRLVVLGIFHTSVLYANKIIITGEGRIAITDDPDLSKLMVW
jgi:hypothetical protein